LSDGCVAGGKANDMDVDSDNVVEGGRYNGSGGDQNGGSAVGADGTDVGPKGSGGKADNGMDVDSDQNAGGASPSNGKKADTRSSARKRKNPPQPQPNGKNKGKPAPKLKPKQKPKPTHMLKLQPQSQAKLRGRSPESQPTIMHNYFEEIEINGGSRLVDMYDLTQVMVCPSRYKTILAKLN
jgi:hypothetical protein